MNKYNYRIESFYNDQWCVLKSGCTLSYAQGWLDARKDFSPRLHMRIVRSDDKIIEEVQAREDVSVGQVAGWPTAEQYKRAANQALEKAKAIRKTMHS